MCRMCHETAQLLLNQIRSTSSPLTPRTPSRQLDPLMQSCSRRLCDVKNAAVLMSLTLAGVGCESIPSLRQTSDPFSVAVSRDDEATLSSPALSPASAAIDEARQHFSAGRLDQSQAILSEQLKRSPKDTAAIELLADAALSCGDCITRRCCNWSSFIPTRARFRTEPA
jgi:hypothetical protein